MEQLSVLEQKLMMLIEGKKKDTQRMQDLTGELDVKTQECQKLAERIACLEAVDCEMTHAKEENEQLKKQIEKLEDTLLVRHQCIEGLNQENELAKMAMDDLIKSIDVLMEEEHQ